MFVSSEILYHLAQDEKNVFSVSEKRMTVSSDLTLNLSDIQSVT